MRQLPVSSNKGRQTEEFRRLNAILTFHARFFLSSLSLIALFRTHDLHTHFKVIMMMMRRATCCALLVESVEACHRANVAQRICSNGRRIFTSQRSTDAQFFCFCSFDDVRRAAIAIRQRPKPTSIELVRPNMSTTTMTTTIHAQLPVIRLHFPLPPV